MTWPTSKPDSTAFDNADDAISTSRAEIKTMSDAVNDVVDFIDPTGITTDQILKYNGTKMVASEAASSINFPAATEVIVSGTGTQAVTLANNSTTLYRATGGSATTINIDCSNLADGVNKTLLVLVENQTSPQSNVSFQYFYNGTAFTGTQTLTGLNVNISQLVCVADPSDSAGRVAIEVINNTQTDFLE